MQYLIVRIGAQKWLLKPAKHGEFKEVNYSSVRWEQLRELRKKAVCVMDALNAFHLQSSDAWEYCERRRTLWTATLMFSFLKCRAVSCRDSAGKSQNTHKFTVNCSSHAMPTP